MINNNNKSSIIATSNRLSLSYLDESMIYDVWKNSLDEDNRKYVPDEVFETIEDANEVVKELIRSYKHPNGPFVYAIIRNEDKANIGYVQLVKIDDGWEIGYHIAKEYTGKGYATEALKIFIDYLKNNTDIKEIYGIALFINKASRKVLQKCNFIEFFVGYGLYQGKRRKIIKTVLKIR